MCDNQFKTFQLGGIVISVTALSLFIFSFFFSFTLHSLAVSHVPLTSPWLQCSLVRIENTDIMTKSHIWRHIHCKFKIRWILWNDLRSNKQCNTVSVREWLNNKPFPEIPNYTYCAGSESYSYMLYNMRMYVRSV